MEQVATAGRVLPPMLKTQDDTRHTPARWLEWFSGPKRLYVGVAIVVVVIAASLAAPWLSPFRPEEQEITARLQSSSSVHWLGTDRFGRDILSRALWGGRISLTIGILSMTISVFLGVLIGATAGYFGGIVDAILMRLTELVLVFPTLFLLILAVATFGRSVPLLVLTISFTSWPISARIIRGEVLKVKGRDFILAAFATGSTQWRIVLRHILPNIVAVIIISATIRVGANIMIEAGLSFLGLGVQPPLASWGTMVANGRAVFRTAWWVTTVPAVTIFIAVLGFNLLGEGLRDLLDPRKEGGQL